MKAHPWAVASTAKMATDAAAGFLLVAVFTDVNSLGILHLLHFYYLYSAQNGGE